MNDVQQLSGDRNNLTNGGGTVNGQGNNNNSSSTNGSANGQTRSQDDAMVGYFFQRPSDPDFAGGQNHYNPNGGSGKQRSTGWGNHHLDHHAMDGNGRSNEELETDFQALALETEVSFFSFVFIP